MQVLQLGGQPRRVSGQLRLSCFWYVVLLLRACVSVQVPVSAYAAVIGYLADSSRCILQPHRGIIFSITDRSVYIVSDRKGSL